VLRLSSQQAAQGSLVQVDLQSAKLLSAVQGEWNGRDVPFWHADPTGKTKDVWRALLGVDLELPAGKHEFVVKSQAHTDQPPANKVASGAPANNASPKQESPLDVATDSAITCSATLTVTAGHFATERLRVNPQFVEPNPQQLARADEERKRLRVIFDHVTPERLWRGRFRFPLAGIKTGGNFGRRRILNGQPGSPHGGVDMPAPTGTPVHATQRGRVVLAGPLYFSGNTVIIDHGMGIYTFYGHLDSFAVNEGQELEAGALLGEVGATGRVTGPHLHWGLTVNRARVNPLQLPMVP
jgi:murein DD-endopeptidase MepM/ murein hydrolase activator NlpD